ncbi:hypothetical protein [Ferroglobus placidus]|uniref:hypothetical protein n=1 Tax=Ferroglobus placidus TaxID=54261 RepID=UPI00064E6F19|nr:hypothetical protein [Ferroglobus placidus]
MARKNRKRKSLDEILQEALENSPTIQSYTIKQLSEITGIPWSTTRRPLERLEAKLRNFGPVSFSLQVHPLQFSGQKYDAR